MLFLKKRFNKKGDTSLLVYVIIVLLIVILIATSLWVYIDDLAKNKKFEREFLARDISLLVTSIYASPNKVLVGYSYQGPKITSKVKNKDNTEYLLMTTEFTFTYDFKQNLLEVYDYGTNPTDLNKASYYYIEDKSILFPEKKIESNHMKFVKDNYNLYVEENE